MSVEVTGVASSSAGVIPNDLFVALPGARVHGAAFAPGAVADGAVAVLTDRDGAELCRDLGVPVLIIDDPRSLLGHVSAFVYRTGEFADDDTAALVFGVTGTNGKTSVAYLLCAIARQLGRAVALSSTAQRIVGSEVSSSGLTTPESNEIHALLATASERDVRTAVLEVSAHALSRHRVDGVRFDVVGFTNLSHDHLDDYPDFERYFAAKRELFTPERAERGVVMIDDEWARRLVGESRIPVTTVSSQPGADWLVTVTEASARRTSFELRGRGRSLQASVPLLGAFSAHNAALAIVMWIEAGFDIEVIRDALEDGIIPAEIPGRAEVVSGDTGPLVLVDYAHTPDAFASLLAGVRAVSDGRIIMVFGADGDRDPSKRLEMGRIAASGSDLIVITDFHPRFEDPAAIRATLREGAILATSEDRILEIAAPHDAIRAAIALAEDGDVVVYAGPGHEDYHEVAGEKIPYSARDAARAALRESGWLHD
ncbi:MAG TPA: UDP-N-acetylmuramoyl-L-alanyl-D-glutamate--2,6-diaminopimelate ligase [Microbacteriaceae bacterium]|nr:UDP-N-acetylmuramoyl-L-alanyl-D-glutamate--2,6-diaminopimelate ligase [Microbacteriaceae bacterium]